MKPELPDLTEDDFGRRLREAYGEPLDSDQIGRIYAHFRSLRRWDRVHGLVGRNEGDRVVERHYAEALAGRRWLQEAKGVLDIGSGGGFPGLILAAVVDAHFTLVESRSKKAAFLRMTAGQMGRDVTCLEDWLAVPLPESLPDAVDSVALRAVKLPAPVWTALAEKYGPETQALVWSGETPPELPESWALSDEIPLPSGGARKLLRFLSQP